MEDTDFIIFEGSQCDIIEVEHTLYVIIIIIIFAALGTEPMASCILDRCFHTEL